MEKRSKFENLEDDNNKTKSGLEKFDIDKISENQITFIIITSHISFIDKDIYSNHDRNN